MLFFSRCYCIQNVSKMSTIVDRGCLMKAQREGKCSLKKELQVAAKKMLFRQ